MCYNGNTPYRHQYVYHCLIKFKDIGKFMVLPTVKSESRKAAFDAVGKGLLVSLFVGMSALAQASPMASEAADVDGNSSTAATGSFSGGQATFSSTANFSGAVSITPVVWNGVSQPSSVATSSVATTVGPQLINAKPAGLIAVTPTVAPGPAASAPVAVTPVVSAPIAVVSPGVVPQQIVAAAPSAPTTTTVATTVPTTPVGASTPLAPSLSVFAVSEPGTMVLLFGGFLALIGIRRSRAVSK